MLIIYTLITLEVYCGSTFSSSVLWAANCHSYLVEVWSNIVHLILACALFGTLPDKALLLSPSVIQVLGVSLKISRSWCKVFLSFPLFPLSLSDIVKGFSFGAGNWSSLSVSNLPPSPLENLLLNRLLTPLLPQVCVTILIFSGDLILTISLRHQVPAPCSKTGLTSIENSKLCVFSEFWGFPLVTWLCHSELSHSHQFLFLCSPYLQDK